MSKGSNEVRSNGRSAIGLWMVLGALSLSGCGSTPLTHYYLLESDSAAGPSSGVVAVQPATIVLSTVVVEPPYDGDRIAYRPVAGSSEIGFYNQHRWAVAPAAAIERMIVATLEESSAVVVAVGSAPKSLVGSAAATAVDLRCRVLRLEEVDRAGSVTVEVELLFAWGPLGGPAAQSQMVVETAPAAAPTVDAVVAALAQAIRSAVGEVAPSLSL